MGIAGAQAPGLVRASRGRLRVRIGGWSGAGEGALGRRLRELPGVTGATASASTLNALVLYDEEAVQPAELLGAIASLDLSRLEDEPAAAEEPKPRRTARDGGRGQARRAAARGGRARIAVRGLDRDPAMARRVEERLESRRDVRRAEASPTTGRVLVEFSEEVVDVEDLLAEIEDVELPDLAGEDLPTHPLDPAPLVQSSARLIGAAAGLALVGARRALGAPAASMAETAPATAAATIGLLDGIPAVRRALAAALGHHGAQLLLGGAGIATLTLAGQPLGLTVAAAGSLRLLTEVRARRAAWRDYEERLEGAARALPGEVVRLDAGDRAPLDGRVLEGTGSAIGHDGLPDPLAPGATVSAGARLHGGPCVVELSGGQSFDPPKRPGRPPPAALERYIDRVGLASAAYAALTFTLTRSLRRTFTALLLINPRAAMIGSEAADAGASARVLRAGVTVVGSRPERVVERPDVLVLDSPRLVSDGLELSGVVPLVAGEPAELAGVVSALAAAAGSPWGSGVGIGSPIEAKDAAFDGETAEARVDGRRYSLGPPGELHDDPQLARLRDRGEHVLVLREAGVGQPLALAAMRPRLAPGLRALVECCRRRGTELVLVERGERAAARALAARAEIPLRLEADPLEEIRARQRAGARVALLSDGAHAAEAFAAADMAIALTSGRSARFPARADVLAPDLSAVAAIVESAARRDQAAGVAVGLSMAGDLAGAYWGLRGAPTVSRATRGTYIASLLSIAAGWLLLRGGKQPRSLTARLADPHPERWGRLPPTEVLRMLRSSPQGLSSAAAGPRLRRRPRRPDHNPLGSALAAQLRSPLAAVLGGGAALSVAVGAYADVPIIAAVIVANAAIGAWQERQAGRAAAALERLGSAGAHVLRDGQERQLPASEVVAGDVLLMAAGDRVVADARLLEADALEVDEAALTGESFPAPKAADAGPDASHVVLDGSDVTVGRGKAVAVAVGPETRLGAIAAALESGGEAESPLGRRLGGLLAQSLPLVVAGGALVSLFGVLRRGGLLAQFALGASAAIAAVPEGLPLLSGVAEAAVARRLAGRHALVRRLAAVEALGRVDVACFDKTGTLTQGRLSVRLVADIDTESELGPHLPPPLRDVLAAAALASPHPDAPGAGAHPTDIAVLEAAGAAGLDSEVASMRDREAPFDPSRSFHAAVTDGRLCVKGAPEAVAVRCAAARRNGRAVALDDAGREQLLAQAERLSAEGLRVLMVAESDDGRNVDDPRALVALGFVAISDPLRVGAAHAVRRCQEAGVRLVMLTGDHPATARAIAREAGLLRSDARVLSGDEIARLDDAELSERIEHVEVIARIAPLDKLRIVEGLRRNGHTVAMTGDGVNDAPALRLADVGVAMGRAGTDVAREAADVVLADDDLTTLVEALVEGRVFWRNMRRALALLLGGNLGELGLLAGASAAGARAPMTTRQILTVNLVTDVLPAVAVAAQDPEHRDLSALSREGTAALDAPLRNQILRRGLATAAPSLAAFVLAAGRGADPPTVAFGSVVATQLAQTLELGRTEDGLTSAVRAAVVGSLGVLASCVGVGPLRRFLGLSVPNGAELLLVAAASLAAGTMGRALSGEALPASRPWLGASTRPAAP